MRSVKKWHPPVDIVEEYGHILLHVHELILPEGRRIVKKVTSAMIYKTITEVEVWYIIDQSGEMVSRTFPNIISCFRNAYQKGWTYANQRERISSRNSTTS